jgi:hypothetical protein
MAVTINPKGALYEGRKKILSGFNFQINIELKTIVMPAKAGIFVLLMDSASISM